jgi:hypothetical protein
MEVSKGLHGAKEDGRGMVCADTKHELKPAEVSSYCIRNKHAGLRH